jgi:hypothetical protein
MFGRGRVRRQRDGRYQLRLEDQERDLLRTLPAQLLDLLDTGGDDPSLARLFPPAYPDPDEAEREAEYRRLMGSDLLARHRGALEMLQATAGAESITEEELGAWLAGVNELRLVLGTRLDVSEEEDFDLSPDDPRSAGLALYYWLGVLQEQLVEAAAEAL